MKQRSRLAHEGVVLKLLDTEPIQRTRTCVFLGLRMAKKIFLSTRRTLACSMIANFIERVYATTSTILKDRAQNQKILK